MADDDADGQQRQVELQLVLQQQLQDQQRQNKQQKDWNQHQAEQLQILQQQVQMQQQINLLQQRQPQPQQQPPPPHQQDEEMQAQEQQHQQPQAAGFGLVPAQLPPPVDPDSDPAINNPPQPPHVDVEPHLETDLREMYDGIRRNEPWRNMVYMYYGDCCPIGYAGPLGESLTNNTIVLKIWLNVPTMVLRDESEGGNVDNLIAAARRESEPLINFIRTSKSLREVYMGRDVCSSSRGDHPAVTNDLCAKILSAVEQNSGISFLEIIITPPMDAFFRVLELSSSVRHLSLDMYYFSVNENDRDHQLMVDAFAVNQSLTTVTIRLNDGDCTIFDRLAVPLSSHPMLETIAFSRIGYAPLSKPFLSLLHGPWGPNFRHVILKDSFVDKKCWKQIAEVVTIEQLTLEGCYFSKKGTKSFVKALKPKVEAVSTSVPPRRPVTLSLLGGKFEGTTMAKVLSRIWNSARHPDLHVSEIESPIDETKDESCTLRDSHFMQLSKICLPCERCELKNIAKFLPHWTQIRDLSTVESQNHGRTGCDCHSNPNPDVLTRAFRHNGSLLHVAVDERPFCAGPYNAILGAHQVRKINAYCERNKHSAEVLSVRPDEDEGLGTLPLFPPVFLSVQPAWKTAPNSLLIGLLAATDTTIGHMTGDDKQPALTAKREATSDDTHRPSKRPKSASS